MRRINLKPSLTLLAASIVLVVTGGGIHASESVRPPDEVRIDILSNKYEPVLFDHALHDSYASCVECHHHVVSAPPSDPLCLPCHGQGKELASVGCRDCHRVDRYGLENIGLSDDAPLYHDDVPGLIGAYHLNCISCHRVIGTGPVGCEACHTKKP